MPEGKTIKQIADELGVTKQAVHQRRKSKELSTALQPFTTTVDGIVYISVYGEKLIKAAFMGQQAVNEPATVYDNGNPAVDTLIAMLKAELDGKNQQIADLNARLADTTAALLAAQKNLDTAQALHIGTIRKQLTGGEDLQREIPQRRGLLARLFGERKGNQ